MPAARISSGSVAGEPEHQVHVVDHQVQHHIHIQAPRTEQVHTVDLEEQRQCDALFQGQNGGVEALQVSHLEDSAGAPGSLDQPVGGGQIDGDRLLHQHIDPRGKQVTADLGMDRGGRGDDRCVNLAGQLARIGECNSLIPRGGFGGASGVGIDNGGKFGAVGFVDHAAVVLSESSGPNNGYSRL